LWGTGSGAGLVSSPVHAECRFFFSCNGFRLVLLLCVGSHAVSSYFDSVTVDGRKIGAEAILILILGRDLF
jgi:hypothetical protein